MSLSLCFQEVFLQKKVIYNLKKVILIFVMYLFIFFSLIEFLLQFRYCFQYYDFKIINKDDKVIYF